MMNVARSSWLMLCKAFQKRDPAHAEERFDEFIERVRAIGKWLEVHGEAIYVSEPGDVCEFVTYGHQIRKGNYLYLVIRFWDGRDTLTLAGLKTPVRRATLLTTGQELSFEQEPDRLTITGLPAEPPTDLFPVIKLECDGRAEACDWAVDRLWGGDPRRMTAWARLCGTASPAGSADRGHTASGAGSATR